MSNYIVVLGQSMIDIYGSSHNQQLMGCHNGNVKISFGGVGRNIVENLLRIQIQTKFITAFGDDVLGSEMKKQLMELGCDLNCSLTVNGQNSATFMAIVDDNQQVLSAVVNHDIMKTIDINHIEHERETIENAEYILFDSNDYLLFEQFVERYKNNRIIIDPVSPFKAVKIKHLLPYFHTIKPNKKEAEVLCGFEIKEEEDLRRAGEYFINIGVKNVFITLDQDGVYFYDGNSEGVLKVNNCEVVSSIGAGDAFVAGIIYGYMNDLSLLDTAKFAYAMSLINLKSNQTVNPNTSLNGVSSMMEQARFILNDFSI